ncbi:hypothetical protein Pmani_014545 [Petrolisthes manimaculis]|uniref:Uncharacterized protein n=1 Tax=Petrolisthes manimaculis TaxID=1843537 RepID=A0AAE1PTE6_9EUCA|nr:hypothetical protein Pmani_014545 [Petrolisthes manimaculis]
MIFALKLWCIWAVLALAAGVQKELSCFQCNVSDTADCTTDYLRPCPTDKPYDKCQTRRRKTDDGKKWVEKRCALANCALPSPEGEGPAFGIFCDTTAENYDCAFCCSESGCNGQAGAGSLSLFFLLRLLPLLTPLLAIQPNLLPFLCLF